MILDNYCSIAQPLLYAVGSLQINDELLYRIVQLPVFAFNKFSKVTSGGLLIL